MRSCLLCIISETACRIFFKSIKDELIRFGCTKNVFISSYTYKQETLLCCLQQVTTEVFLFRLYSFFCVSLLVCWTFMASSERIEEVFFFLPTCWRETGFPVEQEAPALLSDWLRLLPPSPVCGCTPSLPAAGAPVGASGWVVVESGERVSWLFRGRWWASLSLRGLRSVCWLSCSVSGPVSSSAPCVTGSLYGLGQVMKCFYSLGSKISKTKLAKLLLYDKFIHFMGLLLKWSYLLLLDHLFINKRFSKQREIKDQPPLMGPACLGAPAENKMSPFRRSSRGTEPRRRNLKCVERRSAVSEARFNLKLVREDILGWWRVLVRVSYSPTCPLLSDAVGGVREGEITRSAHGPQGIGPLSEYPLGFVYLFINVNDVLIRCVGDQGGRMGGKVVVRFPAPLAMTND